MTRVTGINRNNRSKWKYRNISSATRSIRHSGTVPIPIFHQPLQESEDNQIVTSQDEDYDFEYCGESSNLKTFSQSQI